MDKKKHEPIDRSQARHRNQSGAPEAGGATTAGSSFGGRTFTSIVLRAVARIARSVEAAAYRRLRDLDRTAGEPSGTGGRPNRVRGANHQPAKPSQQPA